MFEFMLWCEMEMYLIGFLNMVFLFYEKVKDFVFDNIGNGNWL